MGFWFRGLSPDLSLGRWLDASDDNAPSHEFLGDVHDMAPSSPLAGRLRGRLYLAALLWCRRGRVGQRLKWNSLFHAVDYATRSRSRRARIVSLASPTWQGFSEGTAPKHNGTTALPPRNPRQSVPAARLTRPEPSGGSGPHNGMVRRGSLEVVESEEEACHETTRGRY
jgi:hypothetical protein